MPYNKCPFCGREMKYEDLGNMVRFTCINNKGDHKNTLEIWKEAKQHA